MVYANRTAFGGSGIFYTGFATRLPHVCFSLYLFIKQNFCRYQESGITTASFPIKAGGTIQLNAVQICFNYNFMTAMYTEEFVDKQASQGLHRTSSYIVGVV
jgi:hypothetical protein